MVKDPQDIKKELLDKKISRERPEHTHFMLDYSANPIVIDYAKHKRKDGSYDIVIFELQNATKSQLSVDSKGESSKIAAAKNAEVYRLLLGENSSFIERHSDHPSSSILAVPQLLNSYQKLGRVIGPNPFFIPWE